MVPLSEVTGPVGGAGVATRTAADRSALLLHVTGLVQGVGFRPFVHRLAMRHHLGGWVLNAAGDVRIEIEGQPPELAAFVRALRDSAPPLARIEQIETQARVPEGREEVEILTSA